MAIGERIHFFRTLRGMTQKFLGMALGFPENPQTSVLRSMRTVPEHQKRM